MLHFTLLLHLISFTTGIIAITMLVFVFARSGLQLAKYAVLGDICFTLTLVFDSVNYYTRLFNTFFPDYVYVLIVLGVFLTITARIYCLFHIAYDITGKTIKLLHRFVFFAVSLFSLGILLLLLALYVLGRVNSDSALQYGFITSNLFAFAGSMYIVLILFLHLKDIVSSLRSFVTTGIIIIGTLEPLALATNIFREKIPFRFPIAFSPILYFLINIAAIYYLSIYISEKKSSDTPTPKDISRILAENYSISQRETEIIEFVLLGMNNREIGEKLYISPNTVKNHIYNVYKKLNIKNRLELLNLIEGVKNSL